MSIKSKAFLRQLEGKRFTFGTMLTHLRKSDGISQVELAERMGVSKGLICDIEKGRRHGSIKLGISIAKAMKFPREVLVQQIFRDQLKRHGLKLSVRIGRK